MQTAGPWPTAHLGIGQPAGSIDPVARGLVEAVVADQDVSDVVGVRDHWRLRPLRARHGVGRAVGEESLPDFVGGDVYAMGTVLA